MRAINPFLVPLHFAADVVTPEDASDCHGNFVREAAFASVRSQRKRDFSHEGTPRDLDTHQS
jgi:hypothetical protein